MKWLGHRDLCPIQWGERCTCPCGAVACPGVDRCKACVLAGTEVGKTTTEEEVPDGA